MKKAAPGGLLFFGGNRKPNFAALGERETVPIAEGRSNDRLQRMSALACMTPMRMFSPLRQA
ncbi:hypothetical protein [Dokdonella sp.]|uniref:hypothetical protein n=1 Tax=Dokdonella sp. TaxID=2291710 RepID=UPI001B220038|nr:hypothetical protein [Dokdonella sp.]MBO9662299.1 hypothetical protein [Dokdonella sp.]